MYNMQVISYRIELSIIFRLKLSVKYQEQSTGIKENQDMFISVQVIRI